jgi:ubiquinone biosynthesis protein UbiJ|tara:strand:- start:210 stop:785 length:576 start_codon:yes stop_codon:yes gene_type:complete
LIEKIKTKLINHLLNQNDWMQTKLKPYLGMVIELEIDTLSLKFTVNNEGQLIVNDTENPPDAHIQMTIKSLIQLITQKKKNGITVKGNLDLANEFSKVIENIEWEMEEDLSRFIGDIPAAEITKISKIVLKQTKKNIINLTENFIEYWQEENKILAKNDDLKTFNSNVDSLEEDVDRVEAKMNNYIKKLSR